MESGDWEITGVHLPAALAKAVNLWPMKLCLKNTFKKEDKKRERREREKKKEENQSGQLASAEVFQLSHAYAHTCVTHTYANMH